MTKKIMFNDKYGLTKAVLDDRKTQTRRICQEQVWAHSDIINAENGIFHFEIPKYKVGEVVAVAQSYCSIADELENCKNATCAAHYEKKVQKASEYISWMGHPGFNNKMFVGADMMIHQIRITYVRVERLQDITDECCLKEGIMKGRCGSEDTHFMDTYYMPNDIQPYCTPREAFAHLINKVSRKDVWQENPYVFVYDFELIK